jgi:hypothetical protein
MKTRNEKVYSSIFQFSSKGLGNLRSRALNEKKMRKMSGRKIEERKEFLIKR